MISYTGYGSPDFVRVLGRVVLSRNHDEPIAADARASLRELYGAEEEQRGWRVFITAPAMGLPVTVSVGDRQVRTRSDRSGYVDVVVRSPGLEPGWHDVTLSAEGAEPVRGSVRVIGADVTVRSGQRHRRHGDDHRRCRGR